jgi:hypothetical protein
MMSHYGLEFCSILRSVVKIRKNIEEFRDLDGKWPGMNEEESWAYL